MGSWVKIRTVDDLPRKREPVLIYKPGRDIVIGYRYTEANAFSIVGGGYMDNPTHWMERPKPPREEREMGLAEFIEPI